MRADYKDVVREKRFFGWLIPIFILSLIPVYLFITAILMPVSFIYTFGGDIYCRNIFMGDKFCENRHYNEPGSMISTLPTVIYGQPPQVLSPASFASLGAIITLFILIKVWRQDRKMRQHSGLWLAELIGAEKWSGQLSQVAAGQLPEKGFFSPELACPLTRIVGEAASLAGVMRPDIYFLSDEPTINCAVIGRNSRQAALIFTSGALNLTQEELKAVALQGLIKLTNGEANLALTMSIWLQAPLYLTAVTWQVRKTLSASLEIWLGALLLSATNFPGYLGAKFLEKFLLKSGQLKADMVAAELLHDHQPLSDALKKIASLSSVETLKTKNYLTLNSFFLVDPNPRRNGCLTSAHPSLKARLEALEPSSDRLSQSH